MTTKDMAITFRDDKARRKTLRLIRQFTSVRAFLPASIELHRQRKLTMQFRGDGNRTHFPTEKAWSAFVEFSKLLQRAEPFVSRSTMTDTHGALTHAFANMLSDGLLPETVEDFVPYLDDSFRSAMMVRAERSFSRLNGAVMKTDGFLLVGQCWLGNYSDLSFDAIPESANGHKAASLRSIATAFEDDSAFIAAARNEGTAKRVDQVASDQFELALAVLSLMLNLTYSSAFSSLWQLRRFDRPEAGFSNQRSFSMIVDGHRPSLRLGLSIRFREQWFDISDDHVAMWHDSMGLGTFNLLLTDPAYRQGDLVERVMNALRHFRLAAAQSAPEMQMSALWVCVESLFTGAADHVLRENLPALVATAVTSLHRQYWPGGSRSPDELKRMFVRYYRHRSRTLHHGRRGHVTVADVQDFSLVVASLLVDVVYAIRRGVRTIDELAQAARDIVARQAVDNSARPPAGT